MTWKPWRKLKGLHLVASLIWALAGLATLASLGFLIRGLTEIPSQNVAGMPLVALFQAPADALIWPLLAQAVPLALCLGLVTGVLIMLWRRNIDDWGRDYYAFGMRFGAAWAVVLGCIQFGCHAWLVWRVTGELQVLTSGLAALSPSLLAWACGAFLGLLGLVLAMIAARSETPLRHKPTILLAALGLFLFLAGMAAVPLFSIAT
jgi:hypothetical protein